MQEPTHKFTVKVKDSLRTVQGATMEEYQANRALAMADLAADLEFVQMAEAVTHAAPIAAQPTPPAPAPAAPAPAPAQPQGWGQQAAPPAPTAVGTDKTMCNHGPRTRRSGTSQYGEWRAYFCPQPKGSPDACEAIFLAAPGKKGHNPAEWAAHS